MMIQANVMSGKLSWDRLGSTWPHRDSSRFVTAGGISWHVQTMGKGETLLLLHGTGASTHSWRDLMPLLAAKYRVLAVDLPGHGFTGTPPASQLTLPGMARLVEALVETLGETPRAVIGHSAGAAIGARMLLDKPALSPALISLNGALLPFNHLGAHTLPAAVKLLFVNPISVRVAAWRAGDKRTVESLIVGTGSHLDEEGLALYGTLFRSHAHVEATLRMMANWELQTLKRELPKLQAALTLIVGARDKAVPPLVAQQVARLVPHATLVMQPHGGHLAHEEFPQETVGLIEEALGPPAAKHAAGGRA
jgi:magnesium chelatase accessory protein